jgi:hypothetical protein
LVDIGRDVSRPLFSIVPKLRVERREMAVEYDNIFSPVHKLLLSVQAVTGYILQPSQFLPVIIDVRHNEIRSERLYSEQ